MLSWQDLKAEVPEEVWNAVTQGDDTLGDRFLDRARAWFLAMVAPCGIDEIDETDSVVQRILLSRALYEFYAFVGKETLAAAKFEDAKEMLRAKFGPCVGVKEEKKTPLPTGAVKVGRIYERWSGI